MSTGQTKCYDNSGEVIDCNSQEYPGQDGAYQSGFSRENRFVDNGDGTFTDRFFGLMWKTRTADINNDGEISLEGDRLDCLNWKDSLQYCDNLCFAGYKDWRLPNVRELLSLVDYGQTELPIHPTSDEIYSNYWSSKAELLESPVDAVCLFYYWSSTTNTNTYCSKEYAWIVGLENSVVNSAAKNNKSFYFVLPVRTIKSNSFNKNSKDSSQKFLMSTGQTKCYDNSGEVIDCNSQEYPGQDGAYQSGFSRENRFVDNGDGTFTDRCFGLMWKKTKSDVNSDGKISVGMASPDCLNWKDSLQYCDNLCFAGYKDWRLPNVRELLSLVDYGEIGLPFGPDKYEIYPNYWTSTTNIYHKSYAWFIGLDGSIRDTAKNTELYVFPVRTIQLKE